ncbi:MAG TPA: hypothetical protein VF131_12945 [Blastocatellia bacterium]|nr:hypothetical protein [Blastocatellia bacterium]
MTASPQAITQLLLAWRNGDNEALKRPGGALYGLRDDPEFRAVRDALEQRVDEMTAQY